MTKEEKLPLYLMDVSLELTLASKLHLSFKCEVAHIPSDGSIPNLSQASAGKISKSKSTVTHFVLLVSTVLPPMGVSLSQALVTGMASDKIQ